MPQLKPFSFSTFFKKKLLTNYLEQSYLLKRFDIIKNNQFIAVSEDAYKYAKQVLPVHFKNDIQLIPNAVNTNRFAVVPTNINKIHIFSDGVQYGESVKINVKNAAIYKFPSISKIDHLKYFNLALIVEILKYLFAKNRRFSIYGIKYVLDYHTPSRVKANFILKKVALIKSKTLYSYWLNENAVCIAQLQKKQKTKSYISCPRVRFVQRAEFVQLLTFSLTNFEKY